jgi:hypothetical protein
MAWLCITKDGTELISSEKLIRFPYIEKLDKRKKKQILTVEDQWYWTWPYSCSENIGEIVVLPKGSIEKLIDKKLTWEDEPYEYI